MAKPTVTGKFGAEDVVLENAATEATLNSLLKAVNRMAGGNTASERRKLEQSTRNLARQTEKLSTKQGDFAKEVEASTGALEDFQSGLSNIGGLLGGFVSGIAGAVSGLYRLGESFALGGDRMSDFAGGLPIIGTFVQVIDDNINTYRQLSVVGATFGNSLEQMRRTAAIASVPLDEFQRMVAQNAETLAVLESSTSTGAGSFARLSQQLRVSDIGQRFMGMGYTMEDLNDRLATYIELEARRDRLNQMSDAEIRQGAEDYLDTLTELSRLTGLQRDELEQNILAQQTEARFRIMRANAVDKQAFDANFAMLQSMGPLGDAFMDLADGAAETTEAQALMAATNGRAMDLAQQMARGLDPAEARRRLAGLGPVLEDYARTIAGPGAQGLQSVFASFPELGMILNETYRLLRLNQDANARMSKEEQDSRNRLTESFAGFEQSISLIRSRLLLFAFDNDLFRGITKNLERFAGLFTPEKMEGVMNALEGPMRRFNRWFGGFIDRFQENMEEDGLWEAIKAAFDEVASNIRTYVFGSRENVNDRGLVGQLSDWYNTSGLKDVFQGMANDIVEMFKNALISRDPTAEQAQEIRNIREERSKLSRFMAEGFYRTGTGERVSVARGTMMGYSRENLVSAQEAQRLYGPMVDRLIQREERIQEELTGAISEITGVGGPDLSDRNLRRIIEGNGRRYGSSAIENFGAGTPMMLHGREAVLTESQLFSMANGVYAVGLSQSQNLVAASINSGFRDFLTRLNLNDLERDEKTASSLSDLNTTLTQLREAIGQTETLSDNNSQPAVNNMPNDKLDQLNNTMTSILAVLSETASVSRKQYDSTRGLSGNLFRGIPS